MTEVQEKVRAAFRQALRNPATRVRVVQSINQGHDTEVDTADGKKVKITVLGKHGDVIYKR
jgi:hypothetical protein